MKRLFITGALALGLAGSPIAQTANTSPDIVIVSLEGKQFGLLIEESPSPFKLRIISENGAILYKESNKDSDFAKRFDVALLEKGEYRLEVESDREISSFPLKVSNSRINIKTSDKQVFIKPVIESDGLTMKLKMETGNLPVDVRIYDEFNNKVHDKSYVNVPAINTTFDFQKPGRGTYRMVVSFNSKSFSETVTLHQ